MNELTQIKELLLMLVSCHWHGNQHVLCDLNCRCPCRFQPPTEKKELTPDELYCLTDCPTCKAFRERSAEKCDICHRCGEPLDKPGVKAYAEDKLSNGESICIHPFRPPFPKAK